MSLSRAQIARLQKAASAQPATDAAVFWFLIWCFVNCGLLWVFSDLAFPQYDGVQGVSLGWVGALLTGGGLIAVCLCYIIYRFLLIRRQAAIDELKVFLSDL